MISQLTIEKPESSIKSPTLLITTTMVVPSATSGEGGKKLTTSSHDMNPSIPFRVEPHIVMILVLALLLLLTSSRSIPLGDILFSVSYPSYLYLVHKYRFDDSWRGRFALKKCKPTWFEQAGEPWFRNWMRVCVGIGVILPGITQLFAPVTIAEAAAPHMYLLLCQIFMEIVTERCIIFHPLPQFLVPVGFSVYRMLSLKTWMVSAWHRAFSVPCPAGICYNLQGTVVTWETADLALAQLNVLLWSYNLFIFMLLRVLPQTFDKTKYPDTSVS